MTGLLQIVAPIGADDTNECINPSGETDLSSVTTGGTNTLTRSTEQQWRGAYAFKCAYVDNTTLVSFSHTFANTSSTYYIKARLYVPSATVCGNISLDASNYSGATETTIKSYTNGTSEKGVWLELKMTLALAADAAGSIAVVASSFTSGSVYVDAVYFSLYDGDYFDGDTEGASWTAVPHNSTSTMPATERLHGVAKNLDVYQTYLVGTISGADLPQYQHETLELALQPGSIYQYTRLPARAMGFPLWIKGSSLANLHSAKRTLFEDLALRQNRKHPFTLRYTGVSQDNELEIRLRAESFPTSRSGFSDKGLLRAISHLDPCFYERGDKYAALDTDDILSVSYLLGYRDGAYTNLDNTMTGQVRAMTTTSNGDLYVGGVFLNTNGDANQDNIAYYDVSAGTWNPLSTGADSNVNKLITDPNGTTVYAGGAFSTTPAAKLAKWDGTAWSGFGAGMNGDVFTLAIHPSTGYLWVGGSFTTGDAVTLNHIGYWNGTNFIARDAGVNNDVNAIAIHPLTGDVYVGGAFTTAGTTPISAPRVAKWNITSGAWEAVGLGTNGTVMALAFDDVGNLYAGGTFTTADTTTVSNLAMFNGSRWVDVGGGVDDTVEFLAWDSSKQELIVSGQFKDRGDAVTVWNGTSFRPYGINFPGTATVYGYLKQGTNEYWAFDTTGTINLPGLTNSVNNTGTAEAYPQLVVTNTAVNTAAGFVTLENISTGQTIYPPVTLALSYNTKVVFDLRPGYKRVLFYPSPTHPGQDVTGVAASPASNFSTWHLVPGNNKIRLRFYAITGTPTLTAYMLWRNRHDSLDGNAAVL